MVNVQTTLARTCALQEARLRVARGELDAARHERQRLNDTLRAQMCAHQQQERRLQAALEARGAELRAALDQGRFLQEELVGARREVEELRATRGELHAARQEGQRLNDAVLAQMRAFQQEERRLQDAVEARGAELGAALHQRAGLQEELVGARREMEELRSWTENQRSREEILLWQVGASRAEAEELRAEVARLEEGIRKRDVDR